MGHLREWRALFAPLQNPQYEQHDDDYRDNDEHQESLERDHSIHHGYDPDDQYS
jgi:hypothetical protein